jgi:putative two-component system response regulator
MYRGRSGPEALERLQEAPCDVMLLDVQMPKMSGMEVLQRVHANPPVPYLKVIMLSGHATSDEMSKLLLSGADDFLSKPFSVMQLQGRVQAALRLKDAQDRSAMLNQQLLAVNGELERNLSDRNSDMVHVRNALVVGLARLVEHRDNESSNHLLRTQRYCRCLAEHAAAVTPFASQIDTAFIEMLACCSPLHDIGKASLPDHILLKPGKLMVDERLLMQTHTTVGAETLKQMAEQHPGAKAFLQMASDITRHHHERFDGTGYPDRLSGNTIPLAARIVAIGDVYDALRCRRVYKPALSHHATIQMMTEACTGQFDPALMQEFLRCADEFDRIYRELPD